MYIRRSGALDTGWYESWQSDGEFNWILGRLRRHRPTFTVNFILLTHLLRPLDSRAPELFRSYENGLFAFYK